MADGGRSGEVQRLHRDEWTALQLVGGEGVGHGPEVEEGLEVRLERLQDGKVGRLPPKDGLALVEVLGFRLGVLEVGLLMGLPLSAQWASLWA